MRIEGFQAVGRPSVVGQIIDSFKEAIIRGDLRPGQRLPPEAELAHQFGVGRSAIRETMKVLEALGVITIQRGNGTYMAENPAATSLSPLVFAILLEVGMTTELLELRSLVQVGYCQLAAAKADEEDWERIEKAAQVWEAYALSSRRDIEQLTRLDLDFHFTILDATRNPLVIKIGRTVEELFFASIRNTLSEIEGLEWGVEGHRGIIRALRGGDPEEIRRVVASSLAYWGREVSSRSPSTALQQP